MSRERPGDAPAGRRLQAGRRAGTGLPPHRPAASPWRAAAQGRRLTPGYFKRPDATAEVFDADGYYRTGDIMAEVGPDELVYVDRRKNVLKLSQGEFVASPGWRRVATSPLVHQIYVYGNSERAYLLAVVVPTGRARPAGAAARQLRSRPGLAATSHRDRPPHLRDPPRHHRGDRAVQHRERAAVGIRKQLRPRLKERYGPRLKQVYARLAEREAAELAALRQGGRDRPVLETLSPCGAGAARRLVAEISPEAHFTDLGGDSLSALSYANLLRDIFHVEVPVGVVLGPAGDLRTGVLCGRRAGVRRPAAHVRHGARRARREVRAADLTLDRFVDAGASQRGGTLPPPAGPPRTVLLTGATGYLGRFLCLECCSGWTAPEVR